MIAADGECWHVQRARDFDMNDLAFNQGDVIDVPIVVLDGGVLVPDWKPLKCEGVTKHEFSNAYAAVEKCWGKDVAEENKHLFPPPTAEGQAIGKVAKSAPRRATPKGPFVPEHFIATPTDSAVEKAAFANAFCVFADSMFRPDKFTPGLYKRLSTLFGLSALGGMASFSEGHFGTAQCRLMFAAHIVTYVPAGDRTQSWVDVEANLKAYTAQKILPKISASAGRADAANKRNLCRQLIEEGYMPDQFTLPWQRPTSSPKKVDG
jgi:hypothetical protein